MEFGPVSPSDYIRAIECGLPSGERNKRWIVVLRAYIDDSGTQGKEPFFTLGGFISTTDNWARFSDEWKAQLDADPPIPYFSMHRAFYPREGPFKGWKKRAIERRVAEFVRIIRTHAIMRVSCSMRKDDYEELIKGKFVKNKKNPFHVIDHPYFLCFWTLINAVIHYQREYGWNTQIDFIFDEQGKMGVETVRWFQIIKKVAPKESKPFFGSPPIFQDDKKFLPLQAADMYAWSIRRHQRENKILYMPLRDELKSLFEMQGMDRMMDSTYLRGVAQAMSQFDNVPPLEEVVIPWLNGP
jgi:hypothetical protein